MVLKQMDDLKGMYTEIVGRSLKGGCTVLILVANDLDAISACKILTSLLKQDNVQYSVLPVFSYHEL